MRRKSYDWNARAESLYREEDFLAHHQARRERVRGVLVAGVIVVLALAIGWPLAHVVADTLEGPPLPAAAEPSP